MRAAPHLPQLQLEHWSSSSSAHRCAHSRAPGLSRGLHPFRHAPLPLPRSPAVSFSRHSRTGSCHWRFPDSQHRFSPRRRLCLRCLPAGRHRKHRRCVAAYLRAPHDRQRDSSLRPPLLRSTGQDFSASRGLSSLLLLARRSHARLPRCQLLVAFASALLLDLRALRRHSQRRHVPSRSCAGAHVSACSRQLLRPRRHTADSRWILFTAGFGGSVLPWIAGFISTHTGSLRAGMLTIPAALLLMAFVLPTLREPQSRRDCSPCTVLFTHFCCKQAKGSQFKAPLTLSDTDTTAEH